MHKIVVDHPAERVTIYDEETEEIIMTVSIDDFKAWRNISYIFAAHNQSKERGVLNGELV